MKHTPGPWCFVVSSHQREWHGWIETDDGDTIAAIANLEEAEANARLFEATLDLLEACKQIVWKLSYNQCFDDGYEGPARITRLDATVKMAVAAIAKAEQAGGPQL